MPAIAYYFLQVILCSGLMMGYYLLVLRNKRFHQYNRFYLLAVAVLSWLVPFIKIQWAPAPVTDRAQIMQLLAALAQRNSKMEQNISQGFHWSGYTIGVIIYLTVAVILLTTMVLALYKVYRLLQHHSGKTIEDVYLILTNAKGTPFSFFRYIFWNEEIDLRSDSGKQILQHEIAHVQQKHSLDKIFVQLVLVAGWCNPFFWLLKKELEMIHEFIADKKAVNNGDTASLAQMLLTAAFPQQKFAMTNPFFFSPIRRRLQMLANNAKPRFSYLRRVVVLPLLAAVIVLFSFRSKENGEIRTLSVSSLVEQVISAVSNDKASQKKPANVTIPGESQLSKNKAAAGSFVSLQQRPKVSLADIIPTGRDTVPGDIKVTNISIKDREGNIVTSLIADSVLQHRTAPGLSYRWIPRGKDSILVVNKPLIVIDGLRMEGGWNMDSLKADNIQSVSIYREDVGNKMYGEAGRHGVISIITKKTEEKPVNPALNEIKVQGYRVVRGTPAVK